MNIPWLFGIAGISPWSILLILLILFLPVILFAPIAKKAGYSKWLALIMVLSIVNIVLLWVFAFVPWPVEKDRE